MIIIFLLSHIFWSIKPFEPDSLLRQMISVFDSPIKPSSRYGKLYRKKGKLLNWRFILYSKLLYWFKRSKITRILRPISASRIENDFFFHSAQTNFFFSIFSSKNADLQKKKPISDKIRPQIIFIASKSLTKKFFEVFQLLFQKILMVLCKMPKKVLFCPFFAIFGGVFSKKNSISSYLRGQIKNCDLKPFELDPKELPKIFL